MTDDETTAQRFEKFHVDNPLVYSMLCRLARAWLRNTGRHKLGINALVERVRWEIAMRTNDPDFKINNNFAPYYARLIMHEQSDLDGLFELRTSDADEWMEKRAA